MNLADGCSVNLTQIWSAIKRFQSVTSYKNAAAFSAADCERVKERVRPFRTAANPEACMIQVQMGAGDLVIMMSQWLCGCTDSPLIKGSEIQGLQSAQQMLRPNRSYGADVQLEVILIITASL